MTGIRRSVLFASAVALAMVLPAIAQETPTDLANLAAAQTAANSKPGPRTVPGRVIPVPPTAIAPGTPWSDLTETGDTYKTNEWLDNVLVSWHGWLGHAAELYANGHDPKDPQLSPIYGDFSGFPPAILTSGTRDLFLSLTVLTHRKLRRAGVEAELQVFEGVSHAQYYLDPFTPESKEAFTEIARFFDKHLGK